MKGVVLVSTCYLRGVDTGVLKWISTVFGELLVSDSHAKSPFPRGQHARHLSNCHMHFLPPVSEAQTSKKKKKKKLSERIKLKHPKQRDALPLFCF